MIWLLPRALTAIVAMIVGGLVGLLAGHANAHILGVLLGGALAVGVIAVFDTARGYRLINWLRDSQEGQAPRDAGFWGEIGYRVERSI